MKLFHRIVRGLRRRWYGDAYVASHWTRDERLLYLEKVVEYLTWQTTNQSALLRHLVGPDVANLPAVRRTKDSFDFQWADIPKGRGMLDDPDFKAKATSYVTLFTGLPAEWFRGKRAIDVGCGMGRYSWALSTLGADVLSLDQSEHGLRQTREACRDFPAHRAEKVDLLKPLPAFEPADLVWSFGVLHHTGDTHRALTNVVPLVKPGGYLYLMLYGEPRWHVRDDFEEVNEYEHWRQRTANMDLTGKLAEIRRGMAAGEFRATGDHLVHGYFDAISPPINDLHTFTEVEGWLLELGFTGIRQTEPSRNLHIIAQRRP
jgi:SAM-dependent methyltransferase